MSSDGPKPDFKKMVEDTLSVLDNHIPALTPQRLVYDQATLLRLRHSPFVTPPSVTAPPPPQQRAPRAKL